LSQIARHGLLLDENDARAFHKDQAHTGTLHRQHQGLGSIIVIHPGHPLVGQVLLVVRRYRERGERLWVIERSDGSRQYVPASWCTPLALPSEHPVRPDQLPAGQEQVQRRLPALSLSGLRDLAALVRHLREREKPPGGEHDDVAAGTHGPSRSSAHSGSARTTDASAGERHVTCLGELRAQRSPAPGAGAGADSAAAGSEQSERPSSGAEEVR
jgi:hypothetical protein